MKITINQKTNPRSSARLSGSSLGSLRGVSEKPRVLLNYFSTSKSFFLPGFKTAIHPTIPFAGLHRVVRLGPFVIKTSLDQKSFEGRLEFGKYWVETRPSWPGRCDRRNPDRWPAIVVFPQAPRRISCGWAFRRRWPWPPGASEREFAPILTGSIWRASRWAATALPAAGL